jgi:hypothetical protein
MEELGLSDQMYEYEQSIDMLHIKYCIIIVVLILLCAFCNRYKLDGNRYYRGKVVSMV